MILVRRGAAHSDRGLELLMLQRGKDARFMPGVWVFAGGVVDDEDFERAAREADGSVEPEELAHRICGARELGEEAGVEIEASALLPWSRWITPEPVPRRFDTHFYVALAPAHCKPEPDRVEMDEARWIAPQTALDEHTDGTLELSFPTIRHLEMFVDLTNADEALAAAAERVVEPILPRVVGTRDSFEVLLPGDAGYEEAGAPPAPTPTD